MKKLMLTTSAAAVSLLAALASPAHAQVIISEVAPFGSGASSNGADWFELTNKSPITINISGWRFDDNSDSFAASAPLTGITSLAPGQSVVFVEVAAASTAAIVNAAFTAFWFGSNVPSNFAIGNYSGNGLGLSQSADAVNIYNAGGTLVTRVAFGSSAAPATFDNSADGNYVITNPPISTLSVVGTNGAFTSASSLANIGSPGSIAAVPEAEGYAMAFAGLGALAVAARRRKA